MDYGTNEYIIEAYSGEEVARVEIIINIQRNETTINSEEKTNTQTNTGSYQSLNDTSTDINGLTIKEITPDLSVATADDINEFLTNNLEGNAYFYWNSLRPIKNNI
ncbi:MAG: hypothetical protein LBD88_00915 [Candidatus Peribacteria bacterium]|nr:hypothetical protein [Candidatus Peribacteria bacterium]